MITKRSFITQNPWLTSLEQVNRLLHEQLHGSSQDRTHTWRSYENADSWLVEIDLPGIPKDKLALTIQPKGISLKLGEDQAAKLEFSRLVPSPEEIDTNAATATHQDGVLKIRLPKKAAEQLVRAIQIL